MGQIRVSKGSKLQYRSGPIQSIEINSILDRLVHNAYRFELAGETLRKKPGGQL